MMRILRKGYRPMALAVSVAFLLATTQPVKATDSYRIYLVEPALSNHAICRGVPLPETCRIGNCIKIMAAAVSTSLPRSLSKQNNRYCNFTSVCRN